MNEHPVEPSVVIVNWKSGRLLAECLGSIFAATRGIRAEVWLVDNASTDGPADRAAQVFPLYMMAHPPLRFLKAYLVQGGILDGGHGLAVSLLTAMYAAAKDLRIWELQHDPPPEAG